MLRRSALAPALLVAALLLAPARAGDEAAAPPPPRPAAHANVLRETLANGLEVLVEERHGAPTVACRVYVKTGSIYEEQFLGAGISHFYEHLLAGGTTSTRGEKETAKILEAIGGASNAYTTYDVTCYHITTSGDFYGTALDLLADWMQNNTLDPREVAREREVVTRELEKDEDEPAHVIWQLYAEAAYRAHPVRVPVVGYKADIHRVTREDLVAFYRARYVPNNALVVVVGDVKKEEALARVRGAFGGWERRPLPPFALPDEPRQLAPRKAEREAGVQVTSVKLGWPTVDLADPDLYALDLLAFVLAQGPAARLTRAIVDEKQLASAVAASSWTPSFVRGQFMIDLAIGDAAKAEDAVRAVLAEVEGAKGGISLEEVARAKRQKIAEHVFGTQTNEDRAEDIAQSMIGTGDPFFSELYVERIQRETPEDLQRVAAKYLVEERMTLAALRPHAPSKAAPEAAAPAPARAPIRRTVLENGLTLLVRAMPGARSVAIQARFRGGVRAETPATSGLSRLLARTMVRGTASHAPEELAAAVDGAGGTLRGESGYSALSIDGTFLADDAAKGVGLLREVLLEPTFPETEVAREKEDARYAIAAAEDDWVEEGTLFLRESLFGPHPYGMRPFGTRESVARLDRAALVAAHDATIVPANGVIALFGDVDAAEAERLLREAFAGWKATGQALPEPPLPAPFERSREVVKEVVKGQTTIALGYPGVSLESGDRYALEMIDAITSGIDVPSGWLHEGLRGGERSLVYFVHALNWMGVDTGIYYIITRCNPPDEARVLDIVRGVQRRIVDELVSDEDLERGKAMNITAFETSYETPAQQAASASASELWGLGCDFADRYPARIRAVTKEDVQRVARKVFGPSVLAVVRPKGAPPAEPKAKGF
jgi:zinc protease